MHMGLRARVPFPESYKGFRLIRTRGRVHALPPTTQVERILGTPGLLDRHPGVLAAATLEEVQRLVDATDPASFVPEVLTRVEGYDIVRYRGGFFAVPQGSGDLDLDLAEDRQRVGVLTGSSPEELERTVRRLAAGVPVEFAGWLPIFGISGNCGAHPQFKHTGHPPAGYRFIRSAPPGEYRPPVPPRWPRRGAPGVPQPRVQVREGGDEGVLRRPGAAHLYPAA